MKRILVLTQWYFPAHKADEFITPCSNLVNELSPQNCFYVLTSNKDRGDKSPLKGIVTNEWSPLTNKSVVRYVPPKNMTAAALKQIIRKINPHAVYINTMLSWRFSLMPFYVLNKTGFKGKIIIAARGSLFNNGVGFNVIKRRYFAFLFARFRLQSNISFHAANEQEVKLLKKLFGNDTAVCTIDNLPEIDHLPIKTRKQSPKQVQLQ
ncbi:hypothetical protein [Longitalea luteola]|uniref:hypothetical protein n=1 Tax=Longitalea luteola TaxID=2812563 RepID=UPI001A966A50|nr:hypothetical protein [Longitalea luteola]